MLGAVLLAGAASVCLPAREAWAADRVEMDTIPAAHTMHAPADTAMAHGGMAMAPLGGGWRLMGMAQAFPIATFGAPGEDESPLHGSDVYLTQPAAMINVESPGSRLVLRTTLNFEGLTQPQGELTYGGWGEGFIDRRHPHTILHEAMLSANVWRAPGGSFSLSAGKGFAPYGTDDPMSRPVAKYPTNHHLSQILERWTVNGVYRAGPWSVEAGLFGGGEPDGPYDLSNIRSFGDSYSGRVARRFGGTGTAAEWELSASAASVAERHHGEKERTALFNGAIRHLGAYRFGTLYGLVEASASRPREDGLWSVLGEVMATAGRHQPYARVEYATRPEYAREGTGDDFFRYHHDDEPTGATRWLIGSLGYAYTLTRGTVGARPFVEVQLNQARPERGGIDPRTLFGTERFVSVTAGFRLFFGGGPMRMGSYGVLDDMTTTHGSGDGRNPDTGSPNGMHH